MNKKAMVVGIIIIIITATAIFYAETAKPEMGNENYKTKIVLTEIPRVYKKCACNNCIILFNKKYLEADNDAGDDDRYYYNKLLINDLLKKSGIKVSVYLDNKNVVYKLVCDDKVRISESVYTDVDIIEEAIEFFEL